MTQPSGAGVLAAFEGLTCVVTGGASFIGSTLVDRLATSCREVVVIDDFSSGTHATLAQHEGSGVVRVVEGDLTDRAVAHSAIGRCDVLFHLAAVHGGRGFIERFPAAMLANLSIDQNVLQACVAAGVPRVVHASSACVYPVGLQEFEGDRGLLREDQAGFDTPAGSFPDGTYGWVKLMGEYQFKVAADAGLITARSARIFTAYGARENESHAAIALIAKALLHVDPYPIWGSGDQTRNFTYVDDTVYGLLHLGADSRPCAYDAVNVGASTHHTITAFADMVFDIIGWHPGTIDRQMDRPVGVANRASDNAKIRAAFGWEPSIGLRDGIHRTLCWYEALPTRARTQAELDQRLFAR